MPAYTPGTPPPAPRVPAAAVARVNAALTSLTSLVAELGQNPAGTQDDMQARLDALDPDGA